MSPHDEFTLARLASRRDAVAAAMMHAGIIAEPCADPGVCLQPVRLLKAIGVCESDMGKHLDPAKWREGERPLVATRLEPAYSPEGHYYRRSEMVRRGWKRWGEAAGSSHGPWQIMWVVAVEHGYDEECDPLGVHGLGIPEVNARIACEVIKRHMKDIIYFRRESPRERWRARSPLDLVADAYNSGSWRHGVPPREYLERARKAYASATEGPEWP